MANINSPQVAQTQTQPSTKIDTLVSGSRLRHKMGRVTLDGTQSDNDVCRFFRVKSSDSITSIKQSNAALTGLTSSTWGFHRTIEDGGAAADADVISTTFTLASARNRVEIRTSVLTPLTLGQPVWELLGLSADPGLEYDVTATLLTAGSASGAITLEIDYVAGD